MHIKYYGHLDSTEIGRLWRVRDILKL